MKAIAIRHANSRDAPQILSVHRASVRGAPASFYDEDIINDWSPDPSPPERLKNLITNLETAKELALVAEAGTQIVAFGSIVPSETMLAAIYVHPDFTNQGIGQRLIYGLESLAKEAGLTELKMDSSLNAEHFYQSNGFENLGRGEHKLKSGRIMACVKMRKQLT